MQNYEASSAEWASATAISASSTSGRERWSAPTFWSAASLSSIAASRALSSSDTRMAATGWMAGPYLSMKLGSGVVFDGRAAWGETENAVAGAAIGDAETERRLVRAKLTGTREVEGWKVAPSLGLVYLEDAVRDGDERRDESRRAPAGSSCCPRCRGASRSTAMRSSSRAPALGGFVGFDDLKALEPMVTTESAGGSALEGRSGRGRRRKGRLELAGVGRRRERQRRRRRRTWTGRLQLNVPLGK